MDSSSSMDETFRMDETFPKYVVQANETGTGFYIFVLSYSLCSFLLIFPMVRWSKRSEKSTAQDIDATDLDTDLDKVLEREEDTDAAESSRARHKKGGDPTSGSQPSSVAGRKRIEKAKKRASMNESSNGLGILLRVAAAEYPDRDPDCKSRTFNSTLPPTAGSRDPSRLSNGRSTAIASAATTSRLKSSQSSKRPPSGIFDVGGRRWKHRRPIGRADVIRNAIQSETGSILSSKENHVPSGPKRAPRGMSDVASSILGEENQGVHPGFINRPGFNHQRLRMGGHSMASSCSVMSSIVDDISPNDAADADDPGRGNIFLHEDIQILQEQQQKEPFQTGQTQTGWFSSILELARPTDESKRVIKSALPLSVGATSEAMFRLVTASFISQYLGSQSMIAYLLVGLFVRLTSEELTGAIIDALSSFLEPLLFSTESNGAYLSGQYIQVAILLQLVLGIPLLVLWALTMSPVINWLIQSPSVALIAEEYTRIAVVGYIFQSISRTFTAVFHICGHEHFESVIDFVTSTLQMVAIACVVALVEASDLKTVAYIQVLVCFSACVAKVGFPIFKGWEKPFRAGIFKNFSLFQNPAAMCSLLRAVFPLLLGTILEYGEWEVLTIILRHLGPAEVATWCLLGAFWDVLEALTEGIGEASAIQVAFLLAANQPERAKKLSYSVLYMGFIQSLLVTSVLYMGGRYLAVLFTSDPTMQHMTNDAIPLLGLANIAMSFSQVVWSLIGAQGRFRLATSVMFFSRWLVTLPIACVAIFVFFFDLNSIEGCLVVGYSTASCVLTFILMRSDWERLGRVLQEINYPVEKQELEFYEDEDDSSDGVGFGNPGENSDDSDEEGRSVQKQSRKPRGHVSGLR